MKNITIAQIGAGYWGKNLIRNLSDMGILRIICDADSSKIDKIKAKNSRITVTSDYDSVLNAPDIDGIVIATPASTHYELEDFETFSEFQFSHRADGIYISKIDFSEPIKMECQHFLECITSRKEPLSSGKKNLEMVKILEAGQHSIKNNGKIIKL